MWTEIIIALLSALIGTYFATFFLSKREESIVKKVRKIAIRALKIVASSSKKYRLIKVISPIIPPSGEMITEQNRTSL